MAWLGSSDNFGYPTSFLSDINSNIKKMNLFPINKTVYAVSKTYVEKVLPLQGARVIPCKVSTYQNDKNNMITICRSSLVKGEITSNSHVLFEKLEDAVAAITDVPVKAPAKKLAAKKTTTKKK